MILEIVAATRNAGKLREIGAFLAGLPVRLLSLADFPGAPEVIEDRDTFAGNAEKKARVLAEFTGRRALADDSGLMVDALGGAPGVYSARYAGEQASDDDNNDKLLAELARLPAADRAAHFVCVIALASPDGAVIFAEGRAEGEIIAAPRGDNGFGYDPLFYYPPLGATFAELSTAAKLQISHRGNALRELAEKMKQKINRDEQDG